MNLWGDVSMRVLRYMRDLYIQCIWLMLNVITCVITFLLHVIILFQSIRFYFYKFLWVYKTLWTKWIQSHSPSSFLFHSFKTFNKTFKHIRWTNVFLLGLIQYKRFTPLGYTIQHGLVNSEPRFSRMFQWLKAL